MKPLGIFASDPGVMRPSWASFALLPDWGDFRGAAEDAERTGVKWVLYLGSMAHATPLSEVLPDLVRRITEAGLRPHLVGVCYHEEWYATWKGGRLAIPGLDPANPAHWHAGAVAIHWWTGQQHAALKAALPGLAIVWIDTFVNDDASFGGWWYQPVPAGVDVLALEAYVSTAGTFASEVEPFLAHAVSTRREPIALVVQGFCAPGDALWGTGPTTDSLAGTARWLAHPRVISGWVFDWWSRGAGVIGLADLPMRSTVEAALGIQR